VLPEEDFKKVLEMLAGLLKKAEPRTRRGSSEAEATNKESVHEPAQEVNGGVDNPHTQQSIATRASKKRNALLSVRDNEKSV
jgi:hypothetical protein